MLSFDNAIMDSDEAKKDSAIFVDVAFVRVRELKLIVSIRLLR